MKTSVTKIMMSFALMGCLIFSASDAMAQGRSRSQGGSTTSRSQSAAVSRSDKASAPTVSRNSSSNMSRSSATPQVSRSSSSSSGSRSQTTAPTVSRSSSSSSRSMTTTPQVNRGSNNDNRGTSARPSGNSGSRVSSGTTSRGTTSGSSDLNLSRDRRDNSIKDASTLNKSDRTKGTGGSIDNKSTRPTSRPGNSGGNIDNGRGGKPGNGGKPDNGGKPGNGGGKPDNGGNGRPNGNRPNGNHGFNHDNHFDYTNHHYRNDFHNNYINHRWSWSRPLPPPARPYRPVFRPWYRPVIPAGWYPYAGAPVIDRILGLTFGTLFDSSLDYLYYNGYEIDGYADHVIYLRNVPLLNLAWEDVMLCYDDYDRLVNAQFIFNTGRYDRHRYDRVYNSLCRIYGQPISSGNEGLSWYGGNSTGWVTLSTFENMGRYYTTLSIGY